MKKFHVISVTTLFLAISMISSGIPHMASAASKKVSIQFSKSTDTMENGTKFTFKAKVKNAKASKIVWKSSNPKIININKKTGKATAKKAGKATITASVNKKLVRLTVTVSPSASELIKANNVWDNLHNGVFTSVYSAAAGNAPGSDEPVVYQEYCGLDDSNNIISCKTVEGSYFTYIHDGIKYTLNNTEEAETSSEEFSEQNEPNNNFTYYSNSELISASINPDKTYTLVYMSEIGTMTAEEKTSIGLDDGICVITAIVEPKNLLMQSYYIINYGIDGTTATTITGTFTYNEENEIAIPDALQEKPE